MNKNKQGKSYAKVMPVRHWNTGPAYLQSNACTPKLKNAISRQYADLYVVLYCFLSATTYESCITFGKSEIIGRGRPPPSASPNVRHYRQGTSIPALRANADNVHHRHEHETTNRYLDCPWLQLKLQKGHFTFRNYKSAAISKSKVNAHFLS